MANIKQTGIVDKDTITMMKRPRCGDPDIDDPRQINEMMGAHEATDCEDHIHGNGESSYTVPNSTLLSLQ